MMRGQLGDEHSTQTSSQSTKPDKSKKRRRKKRVERGGLTIKESRQGKKTNTVKTFSAQPVYRDGLPIGSTATDDKLSGLFSGFF
jgi:hypothetical protein